MQPLPELLYEDILPTRTYLQNICLAMGAVQRAFLPPEPHQWQYGLEVNMRGIITQEFKVNGQSLRISLDLVRHKLRIGETNWSIEEYAAPELFKNIKVWLQSHGVTADINQPQWTKGGNHYNVEQSDRYAAALWWLDRQFAGVKAARAGGLTSPLYLYAHHFDLSLVWFPFDDDRQLGLGFSTGDRSIAEPYIYFTAYPEPAAFKDVTLPDGAQWQSHGFSGAVLPYAALQSHPDQAFLFQTFANNLFDDSKPLLG